jgi:hypothetical protein
MGLIVVSFVIGLILGAGVSVPMSGRACAGALGTLGAINLLAVLAFRLAIEAGATTGGPGVGWLLLWLFYLPRIVWPLSAGLALGGLSVWAMKAWRGP